MSQDMCVRPLLAKAFTLAAQDFSNQEKLYRTSQSISLGGPIFEENSIVKESQISSFIPQGLCEQIESKRFFS